MKKIIMKIRTKNRHSSVNKKLFNSFVVLRKQNHLLMYLAIDLSKESFFENIEERKELYD